MNEPVSSDSLLTRLRERVESARVVQYDVSLRPDEALALIECAEILRAQCDSGCGCEDCHEGRKVLQKLGVEL